MQIPDFYDKEIQRMVAYAIKKFASYSNLINSDDINQIAWIAYKATSDRFNDRLGNKFETLYRYKLHGYIKDEYRKHKISKRFGTHAKTIDICEHANEIHLSAWDDYDLGSEFDKDSVSRLERKQRMVIVGRYAKGMTLKNVGKYIGVSEARASQLHSAAIKRLRNMISKNFY